MMFFILPDGENIESTSPLYGIPTEQRYAVK